MVRKLTPAQALQEYFRHRQRELRILRSELDTVRNGWWIAKTVHAHDMWKHTAFLRKITGFIIEHKDLAQPTAEELAMLEHDLRVYESIHAEAWRCMQK